MFSTIMSLMFMVFFLVAWENLDTISDKHRPFVFALMVICGLGCLFWLLGVGGMF